MEGRYGGRDATDSHATLAVPLPTGAASLERFEHNGASLVDEIRGLDATADAGGRPVPHLFLLHGWGSSREALRGLATLFEHTHTVHLIDLPGFGEAHSPPADWGTIQYTDLVQQYILATIRGPIVLAGHSFGGRVSVRLAARHLPGVIGLILMGVPGLPRPAFSAGWLRRWWIRQLRKALILLKPVLGPQALDWHTRAYGSRDYLNAGALRSVLVRVVNEDLTESAQAINVPTLLLWGTDDRETPLWLGRKYLQILGSRGQLDLLPHKDHYAFNGTGAHLCGYRIRRWLEATARA
jgi:pimeloyl-ACP methyl ester carboxylesterase